MLIMTCKLQYLTLVVYPYIQYKIVFLPSLWFIEMKRVIGKIVGFFKLLDSPLTRIKLQDLFSIIITK